MSLPISCQRTHGQIGKYIITRGMAASTRYTGPTPMNSSTMSHRRGCRLSVRTAQSKERSFKILLAAQPSSPRPIMINLNNLYMAYGLQLYGKIGKKWEYSLGGTFSPRTDLFAETTRPLLTSDSVTLCDRRHFPAAINPSPWPMARGFAITNDQKYTFLADYKYQDWGSPSNYANKGTMRWSTANRVPSVSKSPKRKSSTIPDRAELFPVRPLLWRHLPADQWTTDQGYGRHRGFGVNSLKSPLAYSIVFQYGIKGTQIQ